MNIGIIGLGLMGGSLGKAIIKNTEHKVFGYDKNPETLIKAELVGAVSARMSEDNQNDLDILIVALNPRNFYEAVITRADKLKKGCIVIDIAGNKASIIADMVKLSEEFPHLVFVSTHPMAGREFYGISHATAGLFEKSSVILVPVTYDIAAMHTVKKLYLSIGADEVVVSNAAEHDRIIAGTSQLAHIISSSYVTIPSANEFSGFSAGSFRDLSRVAKMNAPMWSELVFDNRKNIMNELTAFTDRLEEFKSALQNGEEKTLLKLFEEGNRKKEELDKANRERKAK